ncbi:glycosyltransferase [Halovenus sp. WSH3]|uniref:Glycosyltransferase n=1 Tax=Halovenus carboxidivorans TaxID=2692199 RepID=A0A6B0SXW4_9EURY|nr:glycosyltransferase [Halovenus carboxidivorans]MXR50374.1 glycosyltransferase [Halovenus carboxidivorans]
MDLSVVVPTLNARDELTGCLDALAEHAPDAEVLVVNGPSADGTTGMIRERDDVDVLIELADRTVNAARNAGIDRAHGETIALVNHTLSITEGWRAAVREGLQRADVVSGPTRTLPDGAVVRGAENRQIAGRAITFLNAGNMAFQREVSETLDGFDEYLQIGGARDFAHRLAGNEFTTTWTEEMSVTRGVEADGGELEVDRGWKYRSLAYRLVKNYNLRPTVLRRLLGHAAGDAGSELRAVFRGESRPSQWFGAGRDVVTNLARGAKDGLAARRRDGGPRRNPNGRSTRTDRAVTVYDWR